MMRRCHLAKTRKNDGWLRPQGAAALEEKAVQMTVSTVLNASMSKTSSASHTGKEGASMTRRTPLQASAATGIVLIVLLDGVSSYRFLLTLQGVEHHFRAGKNHLHVLA